MYPFAPQVTHIFLISIRKYINPLLKYYPQKRPHSLRTFHHTAYILLTGFSFLFPFRVHMVKIMMVKNS